MSERKYRHRGYQDSGRDEPARRDSPEPGRSRLEGAPRGRSVGTETTAGFKCAECGERVLSLDEIVPATVCKKCGADLHTCNHCAAYDPSSPFECRKPVEARISRKLSKNECAHFEPKVTLDLTGPKPSTPADARAAFDRLFRK
jgi:hypothetical protein